MEIVVLGLNILHNMRAKSLFIVFEKKLAEKNGTRIREGHHMKYTVQKRAEHNG